MKASAKVIVPRLLFWSSPEGIYIYTGSFSVKLDTFRCPYVTNFDTVLSFLEVTGSWTDLSVFYWSMSDEYYLKGKLGDVLYMIWF